MRCTRCYSYAINDHLHGLDLCDVCYWRWKYELLEKEKTKVEKRSGKK